MATIGSHVLMTVLRVAIVLGIVMIMGMVMVMVMVLVLALLQEDRCYFLHLERLSFTPISMQVIYSCSAEGPMPIRIIPNPKGDSCMRQET